MTAPKTDLENTISKMETFALCSGALVVFGLLIETLLAIFLPSKTSPTEKGGTIVADMCVALGVFAELYFARKARLFAEELSKDANARVAEANKIAAQAIKEAAEARERTAEIERLTAWRRVNSELQQKLKAAFAEKASILQLVIEHEMGDTEAFSFAREIFNCFVSFGVGKIAVGSNAQLGNTMFGETLWVDTGERSAEIAAMCLAAFGRSPVVGDLSRFAQRGLPAPNLYIFVGPKPPPDFPVP